MRRAPWEQYWTDLRELVRSTSRHFSSTGTFTPNPQPSPFSYDSTAPWALDQLASGLHSFLSSPTERWFHLGSGADPEDEQDYSVRVYLEEVSDIIYDVFSSPRSMFHPSYHENYLDLGCFGTGVVYEEMNPKVGMPIFRAFPLTDCWVDENELFTVDVLFRRVEFSQRALRLQFPGVDTLFEKVYRAGEDKRWEVMHVVHPASDVLPDADNNPLAPKTDKRFVSSWYCLELGQELRQSGFDYFPYHVPRWSKLSGELYGRSPGMVALPDIRMINAMKRTMIRAAQKVVEPALMVPDEGFLFEINTTPNAINYYRQGLDQYSRAERMPGPERFDVPLDLFDRTSESIMKAFYVDWLLQERKKERQTAFEIHDARQEKLVLMAPMIGRLKSELLGPTISLTYALLDGWGMLPEMPEQLLRQGNVRIHYVSPAFKAQMNSKLINVERYLQQLVPLAQVSPTVFDAINMDRLSQEMAVLGDVSPKVLNSPEEMLENKQKREQAQQAQQGAMVANDASSAIKNVAQARAADPTTVDALLSG